MSIYKPYTYYVSWSSLDRHYYGVRYAQNCNPDDFWISYFTSSKLVKKYREEFGEPDVIEVRRVFDDARSAKRWEAKVLKKLNVLKSDRWLNANISGEHFFVEKHSEETKKKMRENNASKRPEMRKEIAKRQTGENNSFYGKKHTEESKKSRSKKLKGFYWWNDGKTQLRSYTQPEGFERGRLSGRGLDNVSHRQEVREKISKAISLSRTNDPLISCIKCRRTVKGKSPFFSHSKVCFKSEPLDHEAS